VRLCLAVTNGCCHGEDTDTHPLWFLVGVFLTCVCGLMLQIIETRVLSVLANYSLAFFAIAVAMLGMTAGALLVFYRFETTYSPARLSGAMARVMSYFAWSVLGSFGVLLNLAVIPTFEPTLGFVASWTLTLLVLLPPYVLLGVAVSLALTRSSQNKSGVRRRPGRRVVRLPCNVGAADRHRYV
jgi:hypothetical protein